MSNSHTDKQKVLRGILIGWILSAIFIGTGFWFFTESQFDAKFTEWEMLSVTLFPPTLSLAAGIGWAARTRHFENNIDGSQPKAGSPLDITLRYIQNTSEQLLLFLLMTVCLYGAKPQFAQSILPVLGVWFFIARIMFWIGYRHKPVDRAIGFAATFHPTLIFLFISLGLMAFK